MSAPRGQRRSCPAEGRPADQRHARLPRLRLTWAARAPGGLTASLPRTARSTAARVPWPSPGSAPPASPLRRHAHRRHSSPRLNTMFSCTTPSWPSGAKWRRCSTSGYSLHRPIPWAMQPLGARPSARAARWPPPGSRGASCRVGKARYSPAPAHARQHTAGASRRARRSPASLLREMSAE
jgi:hypothetical protein